MSELMVIYIITAIYGIAAFAVVDVINHYGVPHRFVRTKKVLKLTRYIAALIGCEITLYMLTAGTIWYQSGIHTIGT